MATLRKDAFTAQKPKCDRGITSFYGVNRHTGIKMTPPKTIFLPHSTMYTVHTLLLDTGTT